MTALLRNNVRTDEQLETAGRVGSLAVAVLCSAAAAYFLITP